MTKNKERAKKLLFNKELRFTLCREAQRYFPIDKSSIQVTNDEVSHTRPRIDVSRKLRNRGTGTTSVSCVTSVRELPQCLLTSMEQGMIHYPILPVRRHLPALSPSRLFPPSVGGQAQEGLREERPERSFGESMHSNLLNKIGTVAQSDVCPPPPLEKV